MNQWIIRIKTIDELDNIMWLKYKYFYVVLMTKLSRWTVTNTKKTMEIQIVLLVINMHNYSADFGWIAGFTLIYAGLKYQKGI